MTRRYCNARLFVVAMLHFLCFLLLASQKYKLLAISCAFNYNESYIYRYFYRYTALFSYHYNFWIFSVNFVFCQTKISNKLKEICYKYVKILHLNSAYRFLHFNNRLSKNRQ